ncbi:MAG: RNase J family beta-CASP ribonuclease [Clostridia bacterium]|nr:RNase J family beta-CASP ribonuclease [Clostridia bacterium]
MTSEVKTEDNSVTNTVEKRNEQTKTQRRRNTGNSKAPRRKKQEGENKRVVKEENVEKIEKTVKSETEQNKRTTKPHTRTNTRTRKVVKEQDNEFRFKKSPLKIIPLGGLLEVGKNITVFEYENEIVIVDCGLAFPEDDMLGVDLVIPDVTYLERNKDKIKGLVITHGHEDHIGAIPYLLKQINIPIYATKLTVGLINNKLEEHGLLRSTKMITVNQGETINFGKMQIEFIRSCHSIPDAVALGIHTPIGTIIHTGDFKIDYTPIDDERMDFGRLAELGNKGVLALMSDSTNAERKGYTMSESTVGEVFEKLFLNCTKRIVVATFASNVHRVQQIVNSSVKYGRKIAVCGRSMINMIKTAIELGYIQVPDNVFIDIDMINNYTDEQLVIITTGSQGETMSALTRMASGEHRKVTITPNDLVIISATPIPGNEKFVSKVIDDLMKIGAEVVYSALEDVHVSGHACQEEQKLMLALTKPKYFIPVHGEYRHLIAHIETAKKMGVASEDCFIMTNGRILELNENEAKLTGTVPSGRILVDGLGVGDVGNIVLRDRQHLAQDGLIVIVLTMDSATGEVVAGPDVISRGFVYVRESENLMDDVKRVIREEMEKCEQKHIKEWAVIKSNLKDNLRDYIYQKTKRNPMILPIFMEV